MTNEDFLASITLDGEKWRTIPEWERYMVSTKGRVLALSAPYMCGGRTCYRNPQLLKPRHSANGNPPYLSVVLSDGNGKRKQFLVHRLVAVTFIPNPSNLPFINHKDENSFNNCVDNLEWCTHQYNCNYGTHNARMAKTISETAYQRRKVVQLTLSGDYVATHNSIKDAAQSVNEWHSSISRCCRGLKQDACGYRWLYLEDYHTLVNQ